MDGWTKRIEPLGTRLSLGGCHGSNFLLLASLDSFRKFLLAFLTLLSCREVGMDAMSRP